MSNLWTVDGVLKQLATIAEQRRAGTISLTRAEMLERALECQLGLLEKVARIRKRVARMRRRS